LVLYKNNQPIATGGLYHNVGILHEHEKFKKLGPWVALLFTEKNYRNQKFGELLLNEIENNSKNLGYNKIYLFTFTAEGLYLRNGWKPLERVIYKGHETVVMKK
jgi:GNAT superfamily N-acetyltransferase